MWSINSPFPKNINNTLNIFKSSSTDKNKYSNSNDLFNEISFKTPIKEINYNIDNNNFTPFKLDFNKYSGNVNISDSLSMNPLNNNPFIISPSHIQLLKDKEYILLKKSTENSSNNFSLDSKKENINNNSFNNDNSKNNFPSEIKTDSNNNKNPNMNQYDLTKKNLLLLFNEDKDDNTFYIDNVITNNNVSNKKENSTDNKEYILNNKFYHDYNTYKKKDNINKKIFKCLGSEFDDAFSTSFQKRKRLRKNHQQLFILRKFYNEHKYWNKNQIKEISEKIGIKENKVYKWLWDQRNKENKHSKFIVNKKNENNDDDNE